MKKYLLMLATAAVAFGFASCTNEKEDDEIITSEKNEIKLNISVSNFDGSNDVNDGVSTKAAKSGWVNGDKINIWFDGNIYEHSALADLILTYDGTKWVAGSLNNGVSLNPSGTMKVLYEGYNDWENGYIHDGSSHRPKIKKEIQFNGYPRLTYATPMTYTNDSDIEYTYSGSTLTANINSWRSMSYLQVVVSGIDPSEAENYALSIDDVENTGYITINSSGEITKSNFQSGLPTIGVANNDGVAFYFGWSTNYYNPNNYTFTLTHLTDNTTKTYSVSGKTVSPTSKKMVNIKIDKSKFVE